MEISQKNKTERFEYSATLNEKDATCTITTMNGTRRGARIESNGIRLRKPNGETILTIECKLSELPADLISHISNMSEMLEECIAKHE